MLRTFEDRHVLAVRHVPRAVQRRVPGEHQRGEIPRRVAEQLVVSLLPDPAADRVLAGRIAEEKFLGHMTTGAGNDIEKATEIARKMVCEWGMSELGPLTFGKVEGEIFLGRDFSRTQELIEIGYKAGVKQVCPDCTVLSQYAGVTPEAFLANFGTPMSGVITVVDKHHDDD